MEEREKRSNLIEIIVYVANIAGYLSLVMHVMYCNQVLLLCSLIHVMAPKYIAI